MQRLTCLWCEGDRLVGLRFQSCSDSDYIDLYADTKKQMKISK